MSEIEIAGRRIGAGHPCFIIAEAGVNHNGSLELALRLVDAAAEAGADAVKFQTWITELLVSPDAQLADYQRANTGRDESQFAMLKALELGHADFREIQAHCRRRGILFLSTPDEEQSADFLDRLGMPLLKVGSGELDNHRFLRHLAGKGRPIVLSTGMSELSEVEAAVAALGDAPFALLHCVSDYPAAAADCNLRAMDKLAARFRCPVGFSDHTMGLHIAVAAVALGACIVEKHLTLDCEMPGPDHRCSLPPTEFRAMVAAIRETESALGDGIKRPTASERATREIVRKKLVASRDLRAGEILRESDIDLRRSTGGLPACALHRTIGRRLNMHLAKGAGLEDAMLDEP